MNDWKRIMGLATLALILTSVLFAFTIVNRDKVKGISGCGTVAFVDQATYQSLPPLELPGQSVFKSTCRSCHKLDEKLVGPALRNSFEMRDSIWLVKMIVNADKLIRSGDTLAVRVFNEYSQIQHPSYEGLNKQKLIDLIEYLKYEGERGITAYK